MTAFVQLIEFTTSRFDEMQKFDEEWRRRNPDRIYNWSVTCADRDNPGKYMIIVHFNSYEEAMRNSEDPRTAEFAEKIAEMTDGPPVFHNLDVVRTEGDVS